MDAYEAIVTKRDTREYDARPIEDGHLQNLLQAARMAGSSKNEQPIRLIVVTSAEQKQALASCGDFTTHLPASPLVIVVVRVEGSRPFDAGRAAQNMMLTAWAEGIASCPASMHKAEEAAKVLGLPAGYTVANTIAFGYPGGIDTARPARPRKPLDEYVHWDRWDGTL